MSDMEDKLQRILSDPQSIAKALSMVNSFMEMSPKTENTDNAGRKTENSDDGQNERSVSSAAFPLGEQGASIGDLLPKVLSTISSSSSGSIDKNKLNLLMAVKPFLEDTHQKSIDHAVNLVKIAKTAQVTLKTIPKNGGSTKV